jgi:hypothetical protein
MIANVAVAVGGLFLIIPNNISLLATGLTTTVQGTFTFGVTFLIMKRVYDNIKSSEVLIDCIATFFLAIGNITFLFLNNYSVALEIIIVCILSVSFYYIKNVNYFDTTKFSTAIAS